MTDSTPTEGGARLPRPSFPRPSAGAWRARVERELAGADFDRALRTRLRGGLVLEPLYGPPDEPAPDVALGVPGAAPFVRGTRPVGDGSRRAPWVIVSRASGPSPRAENAALRADLAGGASGLWLELGPDAAAGLEGADDGVEVRGRADLATLLDGVLLDAVHVEVDAGAAFLPAAAALIDLAAERGVEGAALRANFGADPLGTLARDGALAGSLEGAYDQLAELVRCGAESLPGCRAITVDVGAYHRAGADDPTELGVAIATAAAYLRALEARGVGAATAAAQIAFGVELDRELFPSIAKLRALRWLWARLLAAAGVDDPPAPWIRAATSSRVLTTRAPWTNVLRASTTTFAAICGGADAISAATHDEALGQPSELGRRVARNLHHVLAEESGLGHVADPAGGAYLVERLTADLAAAGWEHAQRLDGRLAEWLTGGDAARELEAAWGSLERDVARRARRIVGVGEFVQLDDEPLAGAEDGIETPAERSVAVELGPDADLARVREAVADGAGFAALVRALAGDAEPTLAPPLAPHRESEPFESLRDAAEALAAETAAPTVWIATLGPGPEHRARADWVENLYAAGGLAALAAPLPADDAALRALLAERAPAAVCLAGSDERYGAELEPALSRLVDAGVARRVVAGRPGPREAALRAAGATDFIHVGVDVVAHLAAVLSAAGADLEEDDA